MVLGNLPTASDKGGISALRLMKHIGVSWLTARSMLRKIRKAMMDCDSIYRLQKLIEFKDTYVGGERGRGAEGKKTVLVAVETRKKGAGFIAMQVVDTVFKKTVRNFIHHLVKADQTIRTDAFQVLNAVGESQKHEKKATPPDIAKEWLPLVHVMIGNMKKFINGTFHGVSSGYLQEYIDEFC